MSYDTYRTGGVNPGWNDEAEAEADYQERMRDLYAARAFTCAHCEGAYDPEHSDAIHPATFCAIECERAVFDLVNHTPTPDAHAEVQIRRFAIVNRTPAPASTVDQPEEDCPF